MADKTIYVVYGAYGQYDEYREVPICAFGSRAEAEAARSQLGERLTALTRALNDASQVFKEDLRTGKVKTIKKLSRSLNYYYDSLEYDNGDTMDSIRQRIAVEMKADENLFGYRDQFDISLATSAGYYYWEVPFRP